MVLEKTTLFCHFSASSVHCMIGLILSALFSTCSPLIYISSCCASMVALIWAIWTLLSKHQITKWWWYHLSWKPVKPLMANLKSLFLNQSQPILIMVSLAQDVHKFKHCKIRQTLIQRAKQAIAKYARHYAWRHEDSFLWKGHVSRPMSKFLYNWKKI